MYLFRQKIEQSQPRTATLDSLRRSVSFFEQGQKYRPAAKQMFLRKLAEDSQDQYPPIRLL
jgi:hypothetical protein